MQNYRGRPAVGVGGTYGDQRERDTTAHGRGRRAVAELAVAGMTCASRVRRVGRAPGNVPGKQRAAVNLATERAAVAVNAASGPTLDALLAAVERAGYEPRPIVPDAAEDADANAGEQERQRRRELWLRYGKLALGVGLSLPVAIIAMSFMELRYRWRFASRIAWV